MVHAEVILRLLLAAVVVSAGACGGGKKTGPAKPVVKGPGKETPDTPTETDADREKKRHAAALALIPEGTTCLPTLLKDANAPQLGLANVSGDAVICANDVDRARLLGPIACWKIDVGTGELAYQAAEPLPGRGIKVKLDDRCARGYCIPKDAKLSDDKVALIAWNVDAKKTAVLAGDDVHLFDTATKSHESAFSIRGDKGVSNTPSGLYWVGDAVFVEGADAGPVSAVWVFKTDGTQVGPIESLGGKDPKPVSTWGGSFAALDKNRVAVAEQGFSTVTTYEIDSGKRTKLVRKVAKSPCKPEELEAYWKDNDANVTPKCKEFMSKNFAHLIGADVVGGKTNWLVLLRGPRLGELAVLDPKTLNEKRTIKLPWCEVGGGGTAGGASDAPVAADDKTAKPKRATRGAVPKAAKSKDEDPDAGGQ